MEANVETAVRICPNLYGPNELICVQPNVYNNTLQLGNSQCYPVNNALPPDCTQQALFNASVQPLVNYLFEGCDVSVVTFGQSGTGKSYTLLGPGLHCAFSESEHGVIPRFVRETFARMSSRHTDRTFAVHVAWTQICGETVQDLLGAGSVECTSVGDAFALIQLGMSNIAPRCAHTLFTLTVEQRWVVDGSVQHRVSTASFADLGGCEKMYVADRNGQTQTIPNDTGIANLQRCVWALTDTFPYIPIPYTQSILTTLLKDSFGGRAKTLLICTISPLLRDFMETLYTLQFALRAQTIKNIVTVNSYTTIDAPAVDVFGLQFAANQLLKLVANAEDLFKGLIIGSGLSKGDVDKISQWLTLKQECEECLSECSEPHRSLERIDEEIEDSCDDESDSEESEQGNLERLEVLMERFRANTDCLVTKANQSCALASQSIKESMNSSNSEYHLKGARGRRGSIHSVQELQDYNPIDILPESSTERKSKNKQKILKQICGELDGCDQQIQELEKTIKIKETLMQQLLRHQSTKLSARDKLDDRSRRLEAEYRKTMQKMQGSTDQASAKKLQVELGRIERSMQDAEMMRNITEDGSRKVLELENSLHTSKKQLEMLKEYKRMEEKQKASCEKKETAKSETKRSEDSERYWIAKLADGLGSSIDDDEMEGLKHEIKELRKTRECLLEQRCKIGTKSLSEQCILDEPEERKLLQYEEAIEAIDLAIEYKNQVICGRSSASTELALEKLEDRTDRMLMERFKKLNTFEMRVLLQRYFEKVIDLRSSSKKLEVQVIDAESQNEKLMYRIQNYSRTLQQVHLKAEHQIASLQQQNENNLQLMLRYLTNEGDVSSLIEKSKPTALAVRDKSSLIARFTRYARHETVPRQLHASSAPAQAKVTRQKNKLIIQQSSK